jgi:hypothetical protein
MVAVPSLLSVNVSPLGSVPDSVMVAAGDPVVVTVYVPATPVLKEAVLGLVMLGASLLVKVKLWLTPPTLLAAVIVIGKLPPLAAAAVPAIVAVPLPLSVNVMPAGSAPVSVSAGAGAPVVVTVKLNGEPAIEDADAALVMVGRTFSVRVSVDPVPRLTQSDSSPP